MKHPAFFGAKNGTRTRDPDLGKVVLYQLSYFRMLSNNIVVFDGAKIGQRKGMFQIFREDFFIFFLIPRMNG